MELLKQKYLLISDKLNQPVDTRRLNEFTKESIIEMTRKVAENLAAGHESIKYRKEGKI